jgi:hypothetical protein
LSHFFLPYCCANILGLIPRPRGPYVDTISSLRPR